MSATFSGRSVEPARAAHRATLRSVRPALHVRDSVERAPAERCWQGGIPSTRMARWSWPLPPSTRCGSRPSSSGPRVLPGKTGARRPEALRGRAGTVLFGNVGTFRNSKPPTFPNSTLPPAAGGVCGLRGGVLPDVPRGRVGGRRSMGRIEGLSRGGGPPPPSQRLRYASRLTRAAATSASLSAAPARGFSSEAAMKTSRRRPLHAPLESQPARSW